MAISVSSSLSYFVVGLLLLSSPTSSGSGIGSGSGSNHENENDSHRHNNNNKDSHDRDDNGETCVEASQEESSSSSSSSSSSIFFPDDCRVVMAPSTIPNAGWGVFSRLQARKQGQPLLAGDVVIHLHDLEQAAHAVADDAAALLGLHRLMTDYAWDASETGGFYEGPTRVVAFAPGLAMLANGLPLSATATAAGHNIIPFVPTVDEGGQTRSTSPSAGSFTHYHNWTFFVKQQPALQPGQEVFVSYGEGWFKERQTTFLHSLTTRLPAEQTIKSDAALLSQGFCLDNVLPLSRSTTLPLAGRGAQATRALPAGAIILPVPVLPLWEGAQMMQLLRQKQASSSEKEILEVHSQLLRNYCYAHPESSLWLIPYGPYVNLIIHAPNVDNGNPDTYKDRPRANVRLQWSIRSPHDWHKAPLDQLLRSMSSIQNHTSGGLLLELVALRDIQPGEELLMDYGPSWQRAWETHVQNWQPPPPLNDGSRYAPAYVHDDAIQALRTQEELKEHPYPENIFTSCFYDYNVTQHTSQQGTATYGNHENNKHITTVPWENKRGIFQLHNLRPCIILRRENSQLTHSRRKQGTRFVVQIRNRPNLPTHAKVPAGHVHIVKQVPRHAIRLTDKIYTTDQHLPTAFRHEIHLPDDVFPEQWKDLKKHHDEGSKE